MPHKRMVASESPVCATLNMTNHSDVESFLDGTPNISILSLDVYSTPLSQRTSRTILDLPHEILLDVIAKVDWTTEILGCIRLTSRLLNDLIVAHKTVIIKNIASQQYSPIFILFKPTPPTEEWLLKLESIQTQTQTLIYFCEIYGDKVLRHFSVLRQARYKLVMEIGLHLLAQKICTRFLDADDPKLVKLPTLPPPLLMCVDFVGGVVATVLEDSPLVPTVVAGRSSAFRRAMMFMLCTTGHSFAFLVLHMLGNYPHYSDSARLMQLQCLKGIEVAVLCMHAGFLCGGETRPDLQVSRRVEQYVEKRKTQEELDLAVIQALREETVSDTALLKLLENLEC